MLGTAFPGLTSNISFTFTSAQSAIGAGYATYTGASPAVPADLATVAAEIMAGTDDARRQYYGFNGADHFFQDFAPLPVHSTAVAINAISSDNQLVPPASQPTFTFEAEPRDNSSAPPPGRQTTCWVARHNTSSPTSVTPAPSLSWEAVANQAQSCILRWTGIPGPDDASAAPHNFRFAPLRRTAGAVSGAYMCAHTPFTVSNASHPTQSITADGALFRLPSTNVTAGACGHKTRSVCAANVTAAHNTVAPCIIAYNCSTFETCENFAWGPTYNGSVAADLDGNLANLCCGSRLVRVLMPLRTANGTAAPQCRAPVVGSEPFAAIIESATKPYFMAYCDNTVAPNPTNETCKSPKTQLVAPFPFVSEAFFAQTCSKNADCKPEGVPCCTGYHAVHNSNCNGKHRGVRVDHDMRSGRCHHHHDHRHHHHNRHDNHRHPAAAAARRPNHDHHHVANNIFHHFHRHHHHCCSAAAAAAACAGILPGGPKRLGPNRKR